MDFCVFNLGSSSAFSAIQRYQFFHGHAHIFSLSWLHHNVTIAISWWSHLEDRFDVILNGFWKPCGRIFGLFWGHAQLKSLLGSSRRAFLRLQVDLPTSTPTILEGFGEVLGSILEIFRCLWSMLISSCTVIWFSNDFSLISMPSGQAKMSKLHGRSYKNQSFVLFAIEGVWILILDGFCGLVGANFGSQVAVRSDFEGKCYEVCFSEGAGTI